MEHGIMESKCPECKSTNLNYDSHLGELVCNNCGLVVEEDMVDFSSQEGSARKIQHPSQKLDPIKKKESHYQTSFDRKKVREKKLKQLIMQNIYEFNVPKKYWKEIEYLLLKMFEKGNLNGVDYEITIKAIIQHFNDENHLEKLSNFSSSFEKFNKDLTLSEQRHKKISNQVKADKKINSNEIKELKDGIRDMINSFEDMGLSNKYLFLPTKNKIDFQIKSGNDLRRINNRLANCIYPKKILALPSQIKIEKIEDFGKREHIKFMDYHFLNAFDNEKEFLNLLKCGKSKLRKKELLEIRDKTPYNALMLSGILGIHKKKGQEIISKNWKGFFCTTFYYWLKDDSEGKYKENCPSMDSYIKFFNIGKKNFLTYLKYFRNLTLSQEILDRKK